MRSPVSQRENKNADFWHKTSRKQEKTVKNRGFFSEKLAVVYKWRKMAKNFEKKLAKTPWMWYYM